jgi:hypothetical protein
MDGGKSYGKRNRRKSMSVYTKLNEARSKFHELKLTKTGENTFAKYKYFELGDFLIPALKVFNEVGLCAVVSFETDVASMTIVDLNSPGSNPEKIVITSPMGSAALKGCHEVQNIGAVETYQRRYLWVAALEIVEHDALDATTGKGEGIQSVLHTVRGGIGDDLPKEDKDFLKELAFWCVQNISNAPGVANHIASQKLEADQRTYLEDQMDSKTRSAIKKAEAEIRAAFNSKEKAPA